MRQYIILYSVAPDQGAPINPAPDGEPPVIVGEDVLFAAPREGLSNDERADILIALGAILPIEQEDQLPEAKVKAKQLDQRANALLTQTVLTK